MHDEERGASAQGQATPNQLLQKALTERENFLERHPHLRAYQVEIDRLLDSSGNSQARLAVIGMLMQGKLMELQKELFALTDVLKQNLNAR